MPGNILLSNIVHPLILIQVDMVHVICSLMNIFHIASVDLTFEVLPSFGFQLLYLLLQQMDLALLVKSDLYF